MRPSLSVKTLYRSPVKTLLTFILLGVVTFALFSQTAEYAISARALRYAAEKYVGVGTAEARAAGEANASRPDYIHADPRMAVLRSDLRYQPLTQAQIDALSKLPYVTSSDTRYMTAGVSEDYYRPDDGEYFYNYTTRCVVEGTLAEVRNGGVLNTVVNDENGKFHNFNLLILEDCRLLSDNNDWPKDYTTLKIGAHPFKSEDRGGLSLGMTPRSMVMYTPDYIYDTAYLEGLTPGARYVFVLRYDPLMEEFTNEKEYSLYLSDHLADPWCEAVWPVPGGDYLESPAYASLRKLIEITNADVHTFDVVYTEDMGAIMRFAEGKMAITEGRALTRADSENGANVCVISRELAEENGLAVGDTLPLKLGTVLFEQYKSLGAVAAVPERYSPSTVEAALEIVGVYADTDGARNQSLMPNWSYSAGTIFVPKSLLPLDKAALEEHLFSPAEFGFKVENAWDIRAFLEETAPVFEEMGLTLVFFDDGWLDIVEVFQAAEKLSLIRIAVLSGAVAAAIGFTVYLFIGRKKKEYAIMRALGTPRGTSARALALPLLAVAGAAILLGSGAAWIYTVKTVAKSETLSMLAEHSANASIPAAAAAGCILGEFLLTLLFTLLLLWRLGVRPPLALLQDGGGGRKRRRQKTAQGSQSRVTAAAFTVKDAGSPDIGMPVKASALPPPVPAERRGGGGGLIPRYIWRHARRAVGKSALALLLAALLFAAVGQLALMKQSYIDLCNNTVVTANLVGGAPLSAIPSMIRTGYVTDPYYEAETTAGLNLIEARFVLTNSIERFTGEAAEVAYADGYDASCMDTLGDVVIVGKSLAEVCGLRPGDTVSAIVPAVFLTQLREYIAAFREKNPSETASDAEVLISQQEQIARIVGVRTKTFTIAGIVSTPSGAYDMTVFTPGSRDAFGGLGTTAKLEVAEFTLADYRLAGDLRTYGERQENAGLGSKFVMDTSKLESPVKTLKLLNALYPIAVAAALLIGGFLSCLVIVQSSKEAAIMRIQGTTKRKTRTILALEQILLGIAGLVIGACGLLAFKAAELAVVAAQLGLFAALYFAVILVSALICSVLATRRNVLELLQTKE